MAHLTVTRTLDTLPARKRRPMERANTQREGSLAVFLSAIEESRGRPLTEPETAKIKKQHDNIVECSAKLYALTKESKCRRTKPSS